MSVRDTSIDAYIGINEDGSARTQRGRVFIAVSSNDGLTRLKLSRLTGMPINAICGRVRELIDCERVFEGDKRSCSISGKVVYTLSTRSE